MKAQTAANTVSKSRTDITLNYIVGLRNVGAIKTFESWYQNGVALLHGSIFSIKLLERDAPLSLFGLFLFRSKFF